MYKRQAQRLARPVSLIITLIVVVSVIGLVVFGVLPKLGDTFISIGKGIQSFMPKAQSWAEEIFHNNKEIKEWLDLSLIHIYLFSDLNYKIQSDSGENQSDPGE